MTRAWILAVPMLVWMGCQKSEQPFEQPTGEQPYGQPTTPQPSTPAEGQPPVGWEPMEPQGGMEQPGGELAEAPDFNEALGRLRTYAQEIRATQDLQHRDVVDAINTLAAAIKTMPNAQGADTTAITTYADRLAQTDVTSTEHANLTKSALMESVRTLENIVQQQNLTGMDQRLTQIRTQVESIQDQVPLLEQKDAIANSFDQMAQMLDEVNKRPPTGTE